MKTSEYSGFYKLSPQARLGEVAEFAGLSEADRAALADAGALGLEKADHMVENVIGLFTLPMGVALNFCVNGRDYVVPMVTEEPSVVAAASNAAKMARQGGGFYASGTGSVMIAQVQLVGVPNPAHARAVILENKQQLLDICNQKDPVLIAHGGGARDVEVRVIPSAMGDMVVAHLLVDTLDAMGANAVNTMAEACAPLMEKLTGGRAYLRILSNLAIHRLARARTVIPADALGGAEVVDAVLTAYAFAAADPFRATTHNKGIMNGISAVVLATGNDTRAIEAGAHAYAAISGRYLPLTTWEKTADGDLSGTIELPMAVGLVGGATKVHPAAGAAVRLLGVESAAQLGEVIASVGLAQNLAAIKALATEGIQRGHMSLHARNIAATVGATGEAAERLVSRMIADKNVRLEYARELMAQEGQ